MFILQQKKLKMDRKVGRVTEVVIQGVMLLGVLLSELVCIICHKTSAGLKNLKMSPFSSLRDVSMCIILTV